MQDISHTMSRTVSSIILFIFVFSISYSVIPNKLSALSGGEFNASNIIDDSVFFAGNAMSDNEIQAFLNAKVPTCDVNGTKTHSSGSSRATWASANGKPAPPYTCLKDYVQNIPGIAADTYCSGVGSGNVSGAQIIGAVARACNVSPKVLLILLQKEQSFVTDDWPWPIQYTKATGMGCPDTSLGVNVDANQNGCYDEYEGFFKQIYYAARQFKRYAQQPQSFNYAAGRNSYVAYQANAPQCGGTYITPQNAATAALYNYTPYQPNAAALANLYSTGDSCSAYGNRNFWRMFIDWFGSVRTNVTWGWNIVSQEIYADNGRTTTFSNLPTVAPGGKIYARVTAMNVGTQTWNNTSLRLGTSKPRDKTSPFFGNGWVSPNRITSLKETSVMPGQIGTFDITFNAPMTSGSYREYFNLVAEGTSWLTGPERYYTINVVAPVQNNNSQTILNSNETIEKTRYKLSIDGHSALVLEGNGNLVLYRNFLPVWSTNTSGSNADKLLLQPDGNLVLYNGLNQPVWSSNTFSGGETRLALQADGNMVIYRVSSNQPVFSTGTISVPDQLSYANHRFPVTHMLPNQQLESANRKYRLVFQPDGNLVLYSGNRAVWSSNTLNNNVSHLGLQPDGNLVIYDRFGRPIWHASSYSKNGNQLILQDDGNLVIYTDSDVAIWQTYTFGK
jgi:hypothetical protein